MSEKELQQLFIICGFLNEDMTTSELGHRRMTQSRVFYQEPRTSKDTKLFCGLHMTYIPTEIALAWDLKNNDCIRWCYFENVNKIAIIVKKRST